jgi:adenosylcobinamide-phosphate synthase
MEVLMMTDHALFLIIPLVLGFVLDLVVGDPTWLPHPIRLFGNTIAFMERVFNKGTHKQLKGIVVALTLVATTWLAFSAMMMLCESNILVYYAVATIMVFYGLANRCLIDEALKVNRMLEKEGLAAGRKQLSFIVGRDTSTLSAHQIRTAVLETVSENLSDGVVAPLFYYALGGIPLMMTYKIINTLDSMIGYKSERYKDFGMCAARVDDLANLVPARLTAMLMVLVTFSWRGLKFIFTYGHQHSSPNSGYPEAALAGILNCRFGGPNVYHGKTVLKPYIGNNPREVTPSCIAKACWINVAVSVASVAIIAGCIMLV